MHRVVAIALIALPFMTQQTIASPSHDVHRNRNLPLAVGNNVGNPEAAVSETVEGNPSNKNDRKNCKKHSGNGCGKH